MVGDFEKKFPASACRMEKIGCSTNVIESLWGKKGKKYPAHQIARKKKFLMARNHKPRPSRVKWSAPYFTQVHGGNQRIKPKENNGITLNKILRTSPETNFR